MNVTLTSLSGQAPVLHRAWRNPVSTFLAALTALAVTVGAARAETHTNLQAVTASGTSAWGGSVPFTLTGVLLSDPDEMLDSTPHFIPWNGGSGAYQMGAEWQIAFQAADTNTDWGGTFCYMGQCYGNMPWNASDDLSYSNGAWTVEILRLEYDPATLHQFRAGDLIQVTANATSDYGGKRNITEDHSINPANDFTISLVTSNYGLPDPQVITLSNIKNADDSFIFDQTRATGGEHYQGMRVRINNLTLLTTNGWNATNTWGNRLCTATDGTGRTFSLRHSRRDIGAAPTGTFDAVGIFNQESGSGSQGTNGYELIVQSVIPQAVQTLSIAQKAVITWPVSGAAYVVEYSTDLTSTNWTVLTNTVTVINGQNTVLDSMSGARFYRLHKTN